MLYSIRILLLIGIGFLLFVNLKAQPFAIGHASITFSDPARSNRSVPCEIYYPGVSAADNVAVAGTSKYPSIAFGHGFVMTWDAYKNIWNALVPEGFILVFPKTEGSPSPSHGEFGKDLAFVLSEMQRLGRDNQSLFFNRIDSMNCVMGHSMGGGAAFLAAQQSNVVKRLATLAAAETNPSAIQSARLNTMPSLLLAGGNDCVTPPPNHQLPMYDSLKSSCKAYISILGGSHCQMAEDNFLCNFGEATCNPKPTISRAVQHASISRFLLPWLKFQLKRDCNAGVLFDSLIKADKSIAGKSNCELCKRTAKAEFKESTELKVFPNPFNEDLYIGGSSGFVYSASLFDATGRLVMHFEHSRTDEPLKVKPGLPPGIYWLKLSENGVEKGFRLVKQN
jgi:pimeloyl-ACP methyl ester carboxylesterase